MRHRNHALLRLAFAALVCGCARNRPVTSVLAAAGGGEAFEPTIAIDPGDRDRLLVGAMYGVPFARGGTGIWSWRSRDAGRTWIDGRLDPPRFADLAGTPTFAADVIAGFTRDGSALLASMADLPPLGGTFLSRIDLESFAATSVGVYRNVVDSSAGTRVLHDKPWLVVDHDVRSPRRGTVYLSVGAITAGLGAAGPGVPWKMHGSRELLAVSHDHGRTFSTPTVIADSMSFGGVPVIGRGGALEMTMVHIVNIDGAADAVFHHRSNDGGATFEPAVRVVRMSGDTLLELPSLAAKPNGDLLVCWSQGVRTNERTNQIRCATRPEGKSWSAPHALDASLPPGVVAAFPAVAATDRGFYLLAYLVGGSRTQVALFRTDEGERFERVATFASVDGLGVERFCVTTATPCRRTRTDGFAIGDYITLAASDGRLAAAYILPRRVGEPTKNGAVWVTTMEEPRR